MTANTRRQYRSGAVYQRADGKWIGSIEIGTTPDGKRRRAVVTAPTEAACKKAIETKRAELDRLGTPGAGIDPRTTVAKWAATWLDFTQRRVRPKTWATNQSTVKQWIVPYLGKVRLDRLAPADLRTLETAIIGTTRTVHGVERALSTNTALRAHRVLMKMLKDAKLDGHRINDNLFIAQKPARGKSRPDTLDADDARALLRTAAGEPGEFTRWLAALLQGLRQGEALGLQWSAVDLEAGALNVAWQLQPIPYRHGCNPPCGRRFGGDCPARQFQLSPNYEARHLVKGWHLVKPKTEHGERTVAIVPDMATALAAWKAIAPPSPYDLVWPNRDGTPRRAADDREAWHQLQDRAGVRRANGDPYHLHEARHAAVSMMSAAGYDLEVIKDVVGHANITATRLYRHGNAAVARRALEDVAERLQLGSSVPN